MRVLKVLFALTLTVAPLVGNDPPGGGIAAQEKIAYNTGETGTTGWYLNSTHTDKQWIEFRTVVYGNVNERYIVRFSASPDSEGPFTVLDTVYCTTSVSVIPGQGFNTCDIQAYSWNNLPDCIANLPVCFTTGGWWVKAELIKNSQTIINTEYMYVPVDRAGS